LWKPESIELLKENVKQYSPQAIKAVLDWAKSELHTNRTVREADSPFMWSHPVCQNQLQNVETIVLKWVLMTDGWSLEPGAWNVKTLMCTECKAVTCREYYCTNFVRESWVTSDWLVADKPVKEV
jgi:hypothetical protein